MEDFGGWEDVDLDESDLVKKLQASQRLPPNHYDKHTISQLSIPPHNKAAEEEEQNIRAPRRIPGPAGALHRTFHTKDGKTSVNEPHGPQLSALCPQIDLDFGQGPWLCAMDYLHRENPGISSYASSLRMLLIAIGAVGAWICHCNVYKKMISRICDYGYGCVTFICWVTWRCECG